VDDPYDFGAISAANSISDIYAMGAIPVTALNIVAFPPELGFDVLAEILRGGMDKAEEAGMLVVGGHSIKDKEIKYGMAVTGQLTGNSFTPSSRAQAGNLLVLTKPLGSGIITTGLKKGVTPPETLQKAVEVMKRLNKEASRLMMEYEASAATDVTGFGLSGHALRMAKASGVSFKFYSDKIPIIEGTYELLEKGAYSGGSTMNRLYAEPHIEWGEDVPEAFRKIFCDAQTSGGLLIAVSPKKAQQLVKSLAEAGNNESAIIGEVISAVEKTILVS